MSLGSLRVIVTVAFIVSSTSLVASAQTYSPPSNSRPQQPAGQPYPPSAAPPTGIPYQPAQPGQPGAPQQQGLPVAGQVPPVPAAPFQLTPEEQATLELVLREWEQKSGQIQTFDCKFTLFDYNANFSQDPAKPNRTSQGEIRYARPDKGLYKIDEAQGDYWVCDGKAIFHKDYSTRKVIENRLPPELQGKSIADGPLPFVFGAEADKTLRRYWMRIVTPPGVNNQIWLQAFPKLRQDAQNYQRVEIILSQPDLTPFAVQIFQPEHRDNFKVSKVYLFREVKKNDTVHRIQDWFNHFVAPPTPFGWQREVIQPEVVDNGPPGGPQRQVDRGMPGASR